MRAFQVLKINFTTSMVLHFYICHVYMHQSLCIDWNLHPILASINSHDGANLSLRLSFPFFSSHSRLYTRTSNYMTHPCSVAVVTLVIIVIIDWKLSFCNFLLVTFTGPSYVPPCSHFRMEWTISMMSDRNIICALYHPRRLRLTNTHTHTRNIQAKSWQTGTLFLRFLRHIYTHNSITSRITQLIYHRSRTNDIICLDC